MVWSILNFILILMQIYFFIMSVRITTQLNKIKRQNRETKVVDPMEGMGPLLPGLMIFIQLLMLFISDKPDINFFVSVLALVAGTAFLIGFCLGIIVYDNDSFTVGWSPFLCKSYRYEEITGIQENEYRIRGGKGIEYIVYAGDKKVSLGTEGSERKKFLRYFKSRYNVLTGHDIPIIESSPGLEKKYPVLDIYDGHVKSPVTYLIGEMLILILCFAIMICSIVEIPMSHYGMDGWLFGGSILALGIIHVIFSIKVGRHPERYKESTRRWFFIKSDLILDDEKTS